MAPEIVDDETGGRVSSPAFGSGADTPIPVVAIVGPTGTGKSDLGVALARRIDGEIVNGDSMQFYRGMDIGTAKLTRDEQGGIPHHLLDVLDVREEASVATFQREARRCFDEIMGRGRVPILVGGSGLYVRAALDVLDFPGTDPAVRRRLGEELETCGRGRLLDRLRSIDPESAERVKDDRRLVRALEVHEVTGRPFSSFMPQRVYHRPALQIGLDGDRQILHRRLADRVHGMVGRGLEDEVRGLDRRGIRQGKTAQRALGYQQFLRVIDGEATVEQAAEETIIATRQFARRQITWFRADPRVTWMDFSTPFAENVNAAVELFRSVAEG